MNTYPEHREGTTHIFVEMENGVVSSLIFRQSHNAEGTETRIWFDQADLVMELRPIPPVLTPSPGQIPSTKQFEQGYVLYDDKLAPGWWLDPWSGTADLFSFAQIYQGSDALEVTLEPGGAITFDNSSFNTSPYDYIIFYLNGGDTADQQIYIDIKSGDGTSYGRVSLADYIEGYPLQPGVWHWVAVPLSILNPGDLPFAWFDFGDASGNGASTFFIDEIRFVTAEP